ncbi:MAG: Mpo1-like protein [Planctomycetia bacterium]
MRRLLSRWNWPERHQHPVNFWLHMVGIPMTLVGVGCAVAGSATYFAAFFIGGYALQAVGHAIEGNDVGEFIPMKKLFGLPVVPVAPQYARRAADPVSQ